MEKRKIAETISKLIENLELDSQHGCVVVYVGIVKSFKDKGTRKLILQLDRELFLKLCEDLRKSFDSSMSVSIWINEKRELEPGDVIIAIAVAGSSRVTTLELLREIVDLYKKLSVKVEY